MHTIPTLLAALVPGLLGLGGYRFVASGDPWWLVAAAATALSLALVVTRRPHAVAHDSTRRPREL